jgi:hypothetical protein
MSITSFAETSYHARPEICTLFSHPLGHKQISAGPRMPS